MLFNPDCDGYKDEESCVSNTSRCDRDWTACNTNHNCVNLFLCIRECENDACHETCFDTYPNGEEDFNNLLSCFVDICGRCPDAAQESTLEPTPTDTSNNPCDGYENLEDCILNTSRCDSDWAVCDANRSCSVLFSCLEECENDVCYETCIETYPNGEENFNNLISCFTEFCDSCPDVAVRM